jgi:plastocyanin
VIKTVAIKESDFKLSPSRVTFSKPGTYAFKAEDEGSTQHSLTIEGKGLKGQGGEATLKQVLSSGQNGVLTVTFQKAGTYEMYCPVDGHEQIGMKGKVVVK